MTTNMEHKIYLLFRLWISIISLVNSGAITSSGRSSNSRCVYNSTSPSRKGKQFLIIGHAGGDPINYCENTIAATKSAIASGANAIEIDLSISKDGVIFLWHDPNPWNIYSIIRRLGLLLGGKHCYPKMGTSKRSTSLSYYTISSSWFHAVSSKPSQLYKIVTLDEWLSVFANNPNIDVFWFDFKDSESSINKFIYHLDILLKKYYIDQNKIMFSTSSYNKGLQLQKALGNAGLPSGRVTVDTVSWLPFIPSWTEYDGITTGINMCGCCANLGSPLIALNSESAFQKIVKENVRYRELQFLVRKRYVDVFVWTIDSPHEMRSLIHEGVNGIITNQPALLRKVLTKIKIGRY